MYLNSLTCGKKRINSTGLLPSDLTTGASSHPGEDSTGPTPKRTTARTGTKLTGSIGLLASSNSGILMLTALLMVSNTGMLRTRKSGSLGLTLLIGKEPPGRNSTGLIYRTTTSFNGTSKTGRNGLPDNKLMSTKERSNKSLSPKRTTMLMKLSKMMNGS